MKIKTASRQLKTKGISMEYLNSAVWAISKVSKNEIKPNKSKQNEMQIRKIILDSGYFQTVLNGPNGAINRLQSCGQETAELHNPLSQLSMTSPAVMCPLLLPRTL